MKRRLRIPENLETLIRHLAPELKRKMRKALEEIAESPESGKPLREELQGMRSCKLGQLRIVYRGNPPSVIEIVSMGPRKTIYQRLLRSLRALAMTEGGDGDDSRER